MKSALRLLELIARDYPSPNVNALRLGEDGRLWVTVKTNSDTLSRWILDDTDMSRDPDALWAEMKEQKFVDNVLGVVQKH